MNNFNISVASSKEWKKDFDNGLTMAVENKVVLFWNWNNEIWNRRIRNSFLLFEWNNVIQKKILPDFLVSNIAEIHKITLVFPGKYKLNICVFQSTTKHSLQTLPD